VRSEHEIPSQFELREISTGGSKLGLIRRPIVSAPIAFARSQAASALHVRYQEVGLKESGPDRVGGPNEANSDWRLSAWSRP
jgi:hypothetical protein